MKKILIFAGLAAALVALVLWSKFNRGGDVDEVEASIIHRDRFDSSRQHSPLAEADDAIVVDTTGMTIDEVVDHIARMIT